MSYARTMTVDMHGRDGAQRVLAHREVCGAASELERRFDTPICLTGASPNNRVRSLVLRFDVHAQTFGSRDDN